MFEISRFVAFAMERNDAHCTAGKRRALFSRLRLRYDPRDSRIKAFPAEIPASGKRPSMAWNDLTFWAWIFFASEWVIRLIMLVVVPFRRTPAAAKGWLLLIMFEPWVGLLVYLLIGRAKLQRRQREQFAKLPQAMAKVTSRLANHPHIFHPEVGPTLSQAVTLAENLGQSPILGGNAVELLVDYKGTIARLVADIDQAREHVHFIVLYLRRRQRDRACP
jgi:hypothetical protein